MDHYNASAVSVRSSGQGWFARVARWMATLIRPHSSRGRGWSSYRPSNRDSFIARIAGPACAAFTLLLAAAASATTYYTYDNLGRVTQVIESNGTTTQYSYDANGNVTSITRAAGSSTLSIGSLSSTAGAAGSSLTINGSGFSSIPGQNTVTINGVSAQVTYASDNRLVVVIPNGATTGDIEITTQSGSITSSNAFTVVPVSISSFSPTSVLPGATVTINGGGFDPTPANNVVLINGVAATVTSASATQLQITVPASATPGHISVTTPQGAALPSSVDLFVPASGYSLAQIAPVAAVAPGGAGHVYTVNSGQVSVVLFDGTAGQRMTMVSDDLSVPGQYSVYAPDGSTLVSAASISTVNPLPNNLPPLPMTGTYAWYFTPSSTPATATFKLQTDVTGGLPTDGTATATTLAPGQSATYTFSGTAGQSYTLALNPFTGGGTVNASVYNPDGSYLANCGTYQSYYNYTQNCDFTVGASGTYTVRIVPDNSGVYAYSFNTFVIQDFSATLVTGTPGPAVPVNLVPNQHGLLSFAATANQTLALYFSAPALTPNSGPVQFSIKGPGNAAVNAGSTSNGQSLTFNLTNLSAGNYTVRTGAYSDGVAVAMQASLANGVTATLPVNGTSAQFQTYVPGQFAYFTFVGTAGQSVGVGLTALNLTPSSAANSVGISITKPDGSYYTSGTCYLGTTPGCQMSLRNLPQSGTYQLVVTPNGPATETLGMVLSQDQTGSLTLGTAATVNLTSAGQNGLFTFTLSGSQAIVLSGASIATTPANTPVTIYVYDANGNLVQYASMSSSGIMNLGVLAAGTYSVLIVPNNAATGSMSLTVQGGSNATLPLDGSTTSLATLSPGQNAYVSFAATSGQSVSVALSNLTFTPSSVTSATLTIHNPGGGTWTSTCSAGAGCTADYRGLPDNGTYSVTVVPNGQATMSFNATASANYTQALTLGTPTNVTLSQLGQFAMLSFTASAGQSFALQIANAATTPANVPVFYQVYNNSGYGTVATTTTTQAATTFNLSNLAAGTYVLWIGPQTPATTTLQVTLQPQQTTAVLTDGSSTNISTVSPGQNSYVTFSANAGDSVDVALTNLALAPASPNYMRWTLTAPDGSTVLSPGNCNVSTAGCSGGVITMPQTGTYTVNVFPQGQQTMSYTATVTQNVTGTITTGTTQALNLTKLGQEARLAFTVTSGEVLAVSVSGITTVPASNVTTYIGIYTASGSYVTSAQTSSGAALNLSNLAAGNYILWIGPETPATSTMQVSLQAGGTTTLPVDGTSNNVSTAAAGQNLYLKFTANAGDSINVALTNLALSPGSPNYVNWTVSAPDGSTAMNPGTCYTTNPGCTGGMVIVPQTGTYTINIIPHGMQTMSLTVTLVEDLVTTITPGTTEAVNLSQLGQNARYAFTLTSSRSLAINLTGITNVPSSGVTMYMSVNSVNGSSVSYIAGVQSSSGSESLNVNLGAGNYVLWIGPEIPATTSAQLSFQ